MISNWLPLWGRLGVRQADLQEFVDVLARSTKNDPANELQDLNNAVQGFQDVDKPDLFPLI